MRRRNTTSKISDVERLVNDAIEQITPEDWRKCVEHVKKQEKYFAEMDKKFEAYQNDDCETISFGRLDEILATDVAAYQFQNPSKHVTKCKKSSVTNLQHISETNFAILKNE